MPDTPYNFVTRERFTQTKTSKPLIDHRNRHGFSSWGYATTKQARSKGRKLLRSERGMCAEVEFETAGRRCYYNEEQFKDA